MKEYNQIGKFRYSWKKIDCKTTVPIDHAKYLAKNIKNLIQNYEVKTYNQIFPRFKSLYDFLRKLRYI